MHCRPKICPPIVYPTNCNVVENFQTMIVPHIHPGHTTFVNNELYQHVHYFPQTTSVVNEVQSQQFYGGPTVPPGLGQGVAPGNPNLNLPGLF